MADIKIRLIKNRRELEEVFRIRRIVFCREQKIPLAMEKDEFENVSKHVIVLFDGKAIGCARIRFIDGRAKIERIAILKEYRGSGLGKEIMNYVLNYCAKKNMKEIFVHSQYYLKDFYNKFGFKGRGRIFKEAGIDHIVMHLRPKHR